MYEENFQDTELACGDCGATFVFSADEQAFYQEKGFSSPKRCGECRSARKNQGRRSRPQFEAVCSECGCETTVPFQPREDKPVYCSDCFRNTRY